MNPQNPQNPQNTTDSFRIDDPYYFLTKELLEKEYLENKLTDQQIAKKYNIGSKVTIWRRRKHFGIVNSFPGKSNKNASVNREFTISIEQAKKWKDTGLSLEEMAEEAGCSRIVICRRLKELGLVRETHESKKKLLWHTPITDLQIQFLLGTLLGDGNISKGGMFQCNHCAEQKQYIEWKMEQLQSLIAPDFELKPHNINSKQTGKTYQAYYLRTLQNKYLLELRKIFYPTDIKIFPLCFLKMSVFSIFSLAVWYMDDGGLYPPKSSSIGTYGFGYSGNKDILYFLLSKYNIEVRIVESKSKIRGIDRKHHIYIPASQSDKFFSLIAPYIHPSMAYKLPESFRQEAGRLLPQN